MQNSNVIHVRQFRISQLRRKAKECEGPRRFVEALLAVFETDNRCFDFPAKIGPLEEASPEYVAIDWGDRCPSPVEMILVERLAPAAGFTDGIHCDLGGGFAFGCVS